MAYPRRLSLRAVLGLVRGLPVPALILALALYVTACQPIQAPPDMTGTDGATGAVTETVTGTVGSSASSQVTETNSVTVSVTVTESTVSASTPISPPASLPVNSAPQPVAAVVADEATLAAGLAVYRAQYCGVCHTLDTAGTRGTFAPPHDDMGSVAAARVVDPAYTGRATTAREYIIESIIDPQVYVVPAYALSSHRMPVYAHLAAEEVEALAAFLLAQ